MVTVSGSLYASPVIVSAFAGLSESNLRRNVTQFANPERISVKHGECSRWVLRGNTEISLEGRCGLSPRLGNHRKKRMGAGVVVVMGYAEDQEEDTRNGKSAAEETLDMLGWPSLCSAVAGFASTAMGKELCHALTLPSTREGSQALLDETSAALEIESLIGGVLDFGALQTPILKGSLDRLSRGSVLSGTELGSIATLLQVAQTLQRGTASLMQDHKGRQALLQPIARVVEPMVVHQELYKLIWSKVDEDGTVKDGASAQLRQARIQAHTLEQRLQELLNKLVRERSAAGDAQDVIDVDGRLCLTVGAETEKGNAIPGLFFQHGTIAYLEPSQAVPLNNKLAGARAEIQSAEYVVLSEISKKLVPHLSDVHFVLQSIVQLDVVAARGKYSSWIGGRRPIFTKGHTLGQSNHQGAGRLDEDSYDNQDHTLLISLKNLRHPLLVDQHFSALRQSKAKLKTGKKLLGRMRARISTIKANLEATEVAVAEMEGEVAAAEANCPVPIDVHISCSTRVVVITGPNTGGKTAAIKAVGLAALMAKVGLYVPAMDPAYIPWFDAVLADIGDEQSLSQSLSTFSGHLLRIKRIMSESSQDSLVLLDELGAGTDPTEGAALGMALLESFADGGSLLTLATTHHGELKTLKYSDDRFENVSVEFDEERLAPTYRLLWGVPGRSNALNIARRLGLSNEILANAQTLYGAASAELNEVISQLEGAKVEFDQSWKESESLTAEIKDLHAQLIEAAESLHEDLVLLEADKCEQLALIAGAARSRLSALARNQGPTGAQFVEAGFIPIDEQNIAQKGKGTDTSIPHIGQLVYVQKLGRDCKVLEINTPRKEITVQSGNLQIILALKEVQ